MFEHVGLKKLRDYFNIALRMLSSGGLFLNHGIARSATRPLTPSKDSFMDEYVFPGGDLVTLGEVVEVAESVGFEVRDVENLRSHYEQTLRLWVSNLAEQCPLGSEHCLGAYVSDMAALHGRICLCVPSRRHRVVSGVARPTVWL